MENVKKSYTGISAKWAVIYVITSIVITYILQFLNIDQTSSARYLGFIPFAAFLLLAQNEYKSQLGGFITFGQGFMSGFIYALIGGVILAIFTYIYLKFLSPQVWDQILSMQKDQLAEKNMSSDQIDQTMTFMKNYGQLFSFIGVIFMDAFVGAIVALIGAAIFKKERSVLDIEKNSDSYSDPVV